MCVSPTIPCVTVVLDLCGSFDSMDGGRGMRAVASPPHAVSPPPAHNPIQSSPFAHGRHKTSGLGKVGGGSPIPQAITGGIRVDKFNALF
jgi:hypothetical protein